MPRLLETISLPCGRIWSVAHSHARRHLTATASDDGTAAVWGGAGLAQRAVPALAPAPGWPVCSVDFCRDDDNALVLASSDGRAYVYDLRNRWDLPPASLPAAMGWLCASFAHVFKLHCPADLMASESSAAPIDAPAVAVVCLASADSITKTSSSSPAMVYVFNVLTC